MKKILAVVLALVILTSLVLSGCGSKEEATTGEPAKEEAKTEAVKKEEPPKKVSLRVVWWGSQSRADKTKGVLDMFAASNAGVTFETEFTDFKGYWDKMATFAASNSLPDVMQQDYAYIGQYAVKGLLEDLNPYIQDKKLNTADISENAISSGNIDGKLVGISLGINTHNVLYDVAAFEKAGVAVPGNDWTWDDYEKTAVAIHSKTKVQSSLPFVTDPKFLMEYWLRSAGKSMYASDGTALGFDDPQLLISLFEAEQKLMKTGAIFKPSAEIMIKATEENPLVVGKSAMGFSWSNFVVPFTAAAKRPLGSAVLPKAPSGDKPAMYLKPSMFFSVAKTSQNKELAVKLIDLFTNDVEANKVLMADRGVPISSKVRDQLKTLVDPATKISFEYLDVASQYTGPIDPPEPAGAPEITKLAQTVNDEVVNNKTSPQDAAAKFMKQANDILAKNKK